MNPIHTWLDTEEVRRLADRLMHPVLNPNLPVADIGFDQGFVGYSGDAADPAANSAVAEPTPTREIKAVEPVAVAIPASASSAEAAAPVVTNEPLHERSKAFRAWLTRQFSASGMFLIDHQGAVWFEESKHGRLHFVAKNLAQSAAKVGANAGNVRLKISATDFLEAIPVKTATGWVVLGAIVPAALTPSAVAEIRASLGEVIGGI